MFTAWIGTYTQFRGADTGSKGIYRVEVDETGFCACDVVAEIANPAYLALSGDRRFLFSALESESFAGASGGGVASYAVRGKALEFLGQQPTGGRAPCHVSELDGAVFTANYSDGTASVFAHREGALSERTALLVHSGPIGATSSGANPITGGADAARQQSPHAHFARISPQGLLCVVDLGLDRVMLYATGDWSFAGFASTTPGSGPRHLDWIGGKAVVLTELGNTVEVFDPSGDRWERLQVLPTLPEGFSGVSNCAAIHTSPCGRFIVGSNRGHDSLAVFRQLKHGLLERVGVFPCGGKEPRDFGFTPDGQFIVCGLQYSDALALLSFDGETGAIADTGKRIAIPAPVCVLF